MLIRLAEEFLDNLLNELEDKVRLDEFPFVLTLQTFLYMLLISFVLTIGAFVVMYYLVSFLISNINATIVAILSLVVIVPILTLVTARLIAWLLEGIKIDNLAQTLKKTLFILFALLGLFLGPFLSSGYILTLFSSTSPVIAQTSFVLPAITQYFSLSVGMFLQILVHNLSVAGILLLLAIFLGEDAFFVLLYNAVALATLIVETLPGNQLGTNIVDWILFTITALPHIIPEFLGFLAFYLLGVYLSFRYWEPLKEWLQKMGFLKKAYGEPFEEEILIVEKWRKAVSGYYILTLFFLGISLIVLGALIETYVTTPLIKAVLHL